MSANTPLRLIPLAAAFAAVGGLAASAQVPRTIAGAACASPPALHCPDKGCGNDIIGAKGPATEPKSGRKFFIDFPCDLKKNEKVTVVLNLHGSGAPSNWHRNYFPIMDYKDKYRLVIITPEANNSLNWAAADDAYFRDLVLLTFDAIGGEKNAKAFWLAGHSLGGQTSNRLIMNDPFYREHHMTGWVSLSGGRLGNTRAEVRALGGGAPRPGANDPIDPATNMPYAPGTAPVRAGAPARAGRAGPPAGAAPGRAGPPAGAAGRAGPGGGNLAADAARMPDWKFSHIYSSGEEELTADGLPADSKWAQALGCGPQTRGKDIVDTKAGYVNDGTRTPMTRIWGTTARPGTTKAYNYPKCKDGRVVADLMRVSKGHTEGLEPKVTEAIVKLMVSAK